MKDIQTIVQDADTRLLSGLYHSIKERERERERERKRESMSFYVSWISTRFFFFNK